MMNASGVYAQAAIRIFPILYVSYIFAQLCRFNISFAKQQFSVDLDIDDAAFGLAASLFYVGYLLFQLPGGILLSRIGVRRMILCIMASWGIVGVLHAFVQTAGDLYLLRFLLGAAQGCFFPTLIFFLSRWFPDRLRGRFNTLLTSTIPIGGILAGPLAALIMTGLDGAYGLRGWQWLFILEGLPAIFIGILALFVLADSPEKATWLADRDRRLILAEKEADLRARQGKSSAGYLAVLRDANVRLLGFTYFGYFCGLNALALWGPSLLAEAGLNDIASIGWVLGLASLISAAGMLLVGYNSDRLLERRWHVGASGLGAALCLALLPLASDSAFLTAALLTLAGVGLYAILGLFWTIPVAYLKPEAAARGMALINMCGVFGAIVSSNLVGTLRVATGSLHYGAVAAAALLTLSMLSLLILFPRERRLPEMEPGEVAP